jgi:hypothetical protein
MEEERFFIFDQEMIEGEIDFGNVNGDAVDVWGDFVDGGHGRPPAEL